MNAALSFTNRGDAPCDGVRPGSAPVLRPAPITLAGIIAAQDDADARCKPMLDALADVEFHADALSGLPREIGGRVHGLAAALSGAARELRDTIADMALQVAIDHRVWDGVDPADSPLDDVARMVAAHRRAQRAELAA